MRLQILELPSEVVGEHVITPYVLVVSEVAGPEMAVELAKDRKRLKEAVGARGVLIFQDEVTV